MWSYAINNSDNRDSSDSRKSIVRKESFAIEWAKLLGTSLVFVSKFSLVEKLINRIELLVSNARRIRIYMMEGKMRTIVLSANWESRLENEMSSWSEREGEGRGRGGVTSWSFKTYIKQNIVKMCANRNILK